jgi:hypothetical protein
LVIAWRSAKLVQMIYRGHDQDTGPMDNRTERGETEGKHHYDTPRLTPVGGLSRLAAQLDTTPALEDPPPN